ncbi:hypothetical protein [Leuconostoc citreum]|uniref:hypothetical protein n=1 Tax=Leuconostoc citreum TaxID=33964 RepID=UPI000BFED5BE|nr:hypothetical protein [Leuconostoc citreum]
MLSEDKLQIDPTEFAMTIIRNKQKEPKTTNTQFIKQQLTLYLETYYLIKDFNHLEISQMDQMKQKQISELFDKILSGRFQP